MSPSANVRSLQALIDLDSAVKQFSGAAHEALPAAELEIRRTQDWLLERLTHWQHEVQRRQEELRRAELALQRCRSAGSRNGDGRDRDQNCSTYVEAVRRAEARLREAATEMHKVAQALKQFEAAVEVYGVLARRLKELTTAHTQKAQAFLGRAVGQLTQYLATSAPTMSNLPAGAAGDYSQTEQPAPDLPGIAPWRAPAHEAYANGPEQPVRGETPGGARSSASPIRYLGPLDRGPEYGAQGEGDTGLDGPAISGPAGVSTIADDSLGAFSIWNWSGYPAGVPRPRGPIKLVGDAQYDSSRAEADRVNQTLHRTRQDLKGLDIHEIQPVKFGGSPANLANKIALTRSDHAQLTSWWNQMMACLHEE